VTQWVVEAQEEARLRALCHGIFARWLIPGS
jgi:hypothetical protein